MSRDLPPVPRLTRIKATISYPGEAREIVAHRMQKLGFKKFTDYIVSLLAYDLWAERAHQYTGQAAASGGTAEWDLWREIIRDYGCSAEQKTGSYFEHFLERRKEQGTGGTTPDPGALLRLAFALGRSGAEERASAFRRPATAEEVEQYFIEHRETLVARAGEILGLSTTPGEKD